MEKVKQIIFLLLLVFYTQGCDGQTRINEKNSSSEEYIEVNLDSLSFPKNVLGQNKYFKFVYNGDSSQVGTEYQIVWGVENKFKQLSVNKFEVQGNGTLGYLSSNDSVIVLSQSCGTSCTYFVMLPMNRKEPLVYYHPYAIDLNRNLIVYSPVEYSDNIFLIIENFLTGKKTFLKEKNLCPAVFKGDCLEACFFDGIDLVLKWNGSNWKSWDKPDMQTKRMSIEL